jgi:hypothetical protein
MQERGVAGFMDDIPMSQRIFQMDLDSPGQVSDHASF